MDIKDALAQAPIVAILRGILPREAIAVGEILVAAGVRMLEIPMNSPEPLSSVRLLVKALDGRAVVGAGTVLSPNVVDELAEAGGTLCVSPDSKPSVIRRACELKLDPLPGFGTATEAFAAYGAGARLLKLFPASTYSPNHVAALRTVLPGDATMLVVGGVKPESFSDWWAAGARGFGLGSDLYKPGFSLDEIGARAKKAVAAVRALR